MSFYGYSMLDKLYALIIYDLFFQEIFQFSLVIFTFRLLILLYLKIQKREILYHEDDI